jgi:serine/threonine protein kinase
MMDINYNIKIIDFGDAKYTNEDTQTRASLRNTIIEAAPKDEDLEEDDEFEFDSEPGSGAEEFNSAENGPRMRADTFVGTVNYQSPEVIDGLIHTPSLDTWAFGNILFKMLVGVVPFKGMNPIKVYSDIKSRNIGWPRPDILPTIMSTDAIDLINRMIQLNPDDRLGCNLESLAILKEHPFFNGIDF